MKGYQKIIRLTYLFLIILLFSSQSFSQKMVYGYYPSWVESTLPVDNIDYSGVTHIIHAFIYPDSEGELVGVNDLVQSNLVSKAHQENSKVLVSIGGAPGAEFNPSEHFFTVASDQAKLDKFVQNVADFLTANNYDGIDLDWEQPQSAAEKESFTKLVKALKAKFNSTNPNWLLTMATFASAYFHQYFDYTAIVNDIDYFLVMSYNYTGWQKYTSHNAPLYPNSIARDGSVSNTVNQLINTYGIPKEKIVMGTAFYGWKFKATGINENYVEGNAPTTIQYKDIDLLIKSGGFEYYWDETAKVPYVINSADSIYISYDDSVSVRHKAEYVVNEGLAGMMLWALSYDYLPDGSQPLINSIKNIFKYTSVNDVSEELKGFKLMNNYPNPFNPTTKISFEIPERSSVELKVFNLTGEEVSKIFIGNLEAGTYEKVFDASNLSSGVYYYRLTSGEISLTKKMMVLK